MMLESPRSLRHEYDLYVENEIENYKDSVPRSALLKVGDEAATELRAQEQFNMDELLLWAEVDKIIRKRLRIPTFRTWQRRRIKLIEEYRRPEHWGIRSDCFLVREMQPSPESRVLVAGADSDKTALYLAAHGCDVTTLNDEADAVDRVMNAAHAAGLTNRLHAEVSRLASWLPDSELSAVVCTPAAFSGLTPEERDRAIAILQSATRDGGIHLVDTIVAGDNALSLTDLRKRYKGWTVMVQDDSGSSKSFLARKAN